MNLKEALESATSILVEEQKHPTLGYEFVGIQWPSSVGQLLLIGERKQRPRVVHEDPKAYRFKSTNCDLLVKIFSQVAESDRAEFFSQLLEIVRKPVGTTTQQLETFPSYHKQTSALALLAEFCVRTGHLNELFLAVSETTVPTPSLAIMLLEIEQMIALNFNLFSDSELASLPARLNHLRKISQVQVDGGRITRHSPSKQKDPRYVVGLEVLGSEIITLIGGIVEECRKARYFYLKGALQELPNLEIESDKVKVESFLVKLGFSADMVKSLDEAERDYKATAMPFELKNCLGHLRSFLEYLHRQTAKALAAAAGTTVADNWREATLYLREQGNITKQHEAFVTSLYTLLSDEGVHPLTADREYARLLRNMIIEYGVMILTVLDKKGVKI